MGKKTNRPAAQEKQASVPSSTEGKKRWQEPKLSFVKPKLTKHGKLEEVTGQEQPHFLALLVPVERRGRGQAPFEKYSEAECFIRSG